MSLTVTLRRSPFIFAFLLACLPMFAGCNRDGGTGPDDPIVLSSTSARPFAVVEVRGLPSAYATNEQFVLRVGTQAALMLFDSAAGLHRFVIPFMAPGPADVVIPAADRARERTVSLQVLAPMFIGGSPEAAIAEMNGLLDSVQVQTALSMGELNAVVDSTLYGRLEESVHLTEVLQDELAELSPADQREVAALLSEQAPVIRELVGLASQSLAALRDQPETLTSPGGGASVAPGPARATFASSTGLVTTCRQHVAFMERLDAISTALTVASITAGTAAVVPSPASPALAVVTLVMLRVTTIADIAVIAAKSTPFLLDPNGLRLEVSPARIPHDGGQGVMRAWVHRRAAGEVWGTAVGQAMGLGKVFERLTELRAIRQLIRSDQIRGVLRELGLESTLAVSLSQLDGALAEYTRRASGNLVREIPATFDGVQFTAGQSSRWLFTGGASDGVRALRTTGPINTPEEPVSLGARLGGGNDCTASTSGSSPATGVNGFIIALEGTLAFTQPFPEVEVRNGSSTSITLTIRNEGRSTASGVSYQLANPARGPWSPLPWMTVAAPSGPASLGAAQSGTVRFTVSARSDAPEVGAVIPIIAVRNGQPVAAAQVVVRVVPQLSDIVVNREVSTFRIWDNAAQDGDIITVTLNGSTLVAGHSLTNAGNTYPLRYRRGRNVLVIQALNEGSSPPNTAAISFANVVRGSSTQSYGLPTGGTVQLIITYDPDATAATGTAAALPPATYLQCTAGQRGDCRP